MNSSAAVARRNRRAAALFATLVVALIAAVFVVQQALTGASASTSPPPQAGQVQQEVPVKQAAADDARITAADGLIAEGRPAGVDDNVPAVTNLDPQLLTALRRAAAAASADGVELRINSGWRSREFQDRLLADAVKKYGSAQEAARWVATADASEHVSGDAADIGPWAAAEWLGRHGAAFGLCQIYGNEPWHFELRAKASTEGCPRMLRDPTERRR
ncbi:M15 family metallopeptidase [Microbacterium arabinogalactanolyticum]|uniref:M15 family metallopeptidase n=1 Tax=Microbacterium arabinogalactanolyticum TaxID=69365 RepID=UPI00404394ED